MSEMPRRSHDGPSQSDRDISQRRRELLILGGIAGLGSAGCFGTDEQSGDADDDASDGDDDPDDADPDDDGDDNGEFEDFNPLNDPFSLGVASGDPLPDSVVLWTRLAPRPWQSDGGMPDQEVPVSWAIATDAAMDETVQAGEAIATPEFAHSLHIEPEDLEPDTEYYYRFAVESAEAEGGAFESPVGRTKTAPSTDEGLDEFRFAFASCQHHAHGYYSAYHHLAEEDGLDLLIHLGDYIYESGFQGFLDRGHQPARACRTLEDYRQRYAQYKSDENLQAAHAACPWIVTWDDHEVVNNYASDENGGSRETFLERRANAYQAYWEHQPLRSTRKPEGPDLPLYRRFAFGDLLECHVLDTRQYRSYLTSSPSRATDDRRTILGEEQREWLLDGLAESNAAWNVLANQSPMAARDRDPDPDEALIGGGDKWDGYIADRKRILEFVEDRAELDLVVITGDVHNNAVYDLHADYDDPAAGTVATEYVGTSISSNGDWRKRIKRPYTVFDHFEKRVPTGHDAQMPWRHFWDNHRGYARCTVTPDAWRTAYRVVSTVEAPTASMQTIASFRTEAGSPGSQQDTASLDLQVPPSYDTSGEAIEIRAAFHNPAGASMSEVSLELTGLPEAWSWSESPETFESVDPGGSVTASWDVTPTEPARDVETSLVATYDRAGESHRHVVRETMTEPLLAHWRFENDDSDSSNYDRSFSLEDGAGFDDEVAIEGEYALDLDGKTAYIKISRERSVQYLDTFLHEAFVERTVAMWLRPETTGGIRDVFTEGGRRYGLALRINDGTLETGVASKARRATLSAEFASTEWTHVAVVFDAGRFALYIDGNEVDSAQNVGFDWVPDHRSEGAIGRAGGGSYVFRGTGDHFAGHVDDARIYNRALRGEAIEELATPSAE